MASCLSKQSLVASNIFYQEVMEWLAKILR